MKPKVSFIIPVYNSEKFLNRCIDSVLGQSYKNIEIILVNDGSTDKSAVICNSYAEKYDVKAIHIKNSGAGGARNIGLKYATGDYISFIDSDDWIHHDMTRTMLSVFKKDEVDIVECDLKIASDYKIDSEIENHYSIVKESRIQSLKRIIRNQRFSVVVRLYKKDILNGLHFRERIMSEDVYFTIEVLNRINCLARIPNKLYYYYINKESISKKPYNLKKLDTLDSALFVQNEISKGVSDSELRDISRYFLLEVLMLHYKELHYNNSLDPCMTHRRRIKTIIKQNYSIKDSSLHLKIARYLPIPFFNLLIKLNSKLMH